MTAQKISNKKSLIYRSVIIKQWIRLIDFFHQNKKNQPSHTQVTMLHQNFCPQPASGKRQGAIYNFAIGWCFHHHHFVYHTILLSFTWLEAILVIVREVYTSTGSQCRMGNTTSSRRFLVIFNLWKAIPCHVPLYCT